MSDVADMDENSAILDEIATSEPTETPINLTENQRKTPETVETTDEPTLSELLTDESDKSAVNVNEANDKGIQCELLQTDCDESKKSGNFSEETEKVNDEAESKVTPNIDTTSKAIEQNQPGENISEATEKLNEEAVENETSRETNIPLKIEEDDAKSQCESIDRDNIDETSANAEEDTSHKTTKTEATEKLNEGTAEISTLLEKKSEKDDTESRCEPINKDNFHERSAVPEENASSEPNKTHVNGSSKCNQTSAEPGQPTDEPSKNQSTTDQPEKNSLPTNEILEKGIQTADNDSKKSENLSAETAETKVFTQNESRRIDQSLLDNITSEKDPDKTYKSDQDKIEKSTSDLPSECIQELKMKLEHTKLENSKLEGKVQVLNEKYQNIMEMHCDVVAAYHVEKTKIVQEYEEKVRDILIDKTQLQEQIKHVEATVIANVHNVSIFKEAEKAQKNEIDTNHIKSDENNEDNCSLIKEKEIEGYDKLLKKESSRDNISEMDEETNETSSTFPKTVEEEEEDKEKHKPEAEIADLKMVLSEVDEQVKETCSTFLEKVENEEEPKEKRKVETKTTDLKRTLSEDEHEKLVGKDEIFKFETFEPSHISRTNLVEMQTKINELQEVTKSLQKEIDVLKTVINQNESNINGTKKLQQDRSYAEKSRKDDSKEENIFSEKEKELQEKNQVVQMKSVMSHLAELEGHEESTESFFPKTLEKFDISMEQEDEQHETGFEKLETEKTNLITNLTNKEEPSEHNLNKDEESETDTKQSSESSEISGTELVKTKSKINELQKMIKSLQEQLDNIKTCDEPKESSITEEIQEDVQNGEEANKNLKKEENVFPEKEKEIEEFNQSSKSVLLDVIEQKIDTATSTPNTVDEYNILIRKTEEEHKDKLKKLETEKAILERMLKEQEKHYVCDDKTKTPELCDTSDTNEFRLSAMEIKIDEVQVALKSLQLQLKDIKKVEINERILSETNLNEEEEKKLNESKKYTIIEKESPLKNKDVSQDDDKTQRITTPSNPLSEKEKNDYDANLSKSRKEDEILLRKTKEGHNEQHNEQSDNFKYGDKVEQMQSKINDLQEEVKSLEEKNESILNSCREKLEDMAVSKETAIQNLELQIKTLMKEKEKVAICNKDKETDGAHLCTNTLLIKSNYEREVVEIRAEMTEKCAKESSLVKEVTTQAVVKKYEEILAKVSDIREESLTMFTESFKSYEDKIHDIHVIYEQKLESLRQQKEDEQCAAAQNQIEALQNKCKDLETHYANAMDSMNKEMEEKWEDRMREMEEDFEKQKEMLKTNYENAIGEMENEMKENWENERKEMKATFEKEKEVLKTQYIFEMDEMKRKTNERWENEKKEMDAKFEKEKQVLGSHFKDEMDEMKNKANESWENEKREMKAKFEKEKESLESRHKNDINVVKNKAKERWENEKEKMEAKFENEKQLLESQHKGKMDEIKSKANASLENERREMEAQFQKQKEVLLGQNEKGEQKYESKINDLSESYERKISQMALDYSALEEKYYAAIKQLEEILGSMKMSRECAVTSCVTTIICPRCSNKETDKIATDASADEYLQLNDNPSKKSQVREGKIVIKDFKHEHEISTTKDDVNKLPLTIFKDKDKKQQNSMKNAKTLMECDSLPERENKNSTTVFKSCVLSRSNKDCLIASSFQESPPATLQKDNGCFQAVKIEATGKQKDRCKNSPEVEKPFRDFQKGLQMLKEKQDLDELLKSLQNEISKEQFNFLQAMQFKKDGQFDELSQSSAKRMVEEKVHLETELKIVTQEILNLLEDNGLQRNSQKITAKAKQKDEIELSLEILEENVNAEPMRAAEALTCLLETKSRCQDQLEALDKGLKKTKEEIELKLKHEKGFVNSLPEQLILELCISP